MQDKIIAAITLYLASEMHVRALADSTIFITSKKFDSGIDAIKSTATEIYTAIAPLVEAGEPDWKYAPEWAEWRITDEKGNLAYSLGFPSANTQMQVPKEFGGTVKVEKRPQ